MTNYNDGKWHGWNGGECPVHPKSVVDMVWPSGLDDSKAFRDVRLAGNFSWGVSDTSLPMLFRVVEEYKEPREFWVNVYEGDCYSSLYQSKESADMLATSNRLDCIHVREVI